MQVYARTEEGQWAAYSAESALPRKLKTLLKAIDGKTVLPVYLKSLGAFGDVELILQSLYDAGLLTVALPEAPKLNSRESDAASPPAIARPSAKDQKAEKRPVAADTVKNQRLVGDGNSSWPNQAPSNNSKAWGFAGNTMEVTRPLATPQRKDWKSALELMSDFVLTHMPQDAFTILKDIESVQSKNELTVVLAAYWQFIQSTGDLGSEHMRLLKQLIHDSD